MASRDLIKRRSKGVQKQHLRRYKSGKVSRVNEGIKKNFRVSRNNHIVQTPLKASAPLLRGVSLEARHGLVDKRKMVVSIPKMSLDLAYKYYVDMPVELVGFVKDDNFSMAKTSILLGDLKKAYAEAVRNKESSFFIDSHELVVDYAKYMIEYLENNGLKDNQFFSVTSKEDSGEVAHMPRCLTCQSISEDHGIILLDKPSNNAPVISGLCKSCFEKFLFKEDGVVILGVDEDMRVVDYAIIKMDAFKSMFSDFKITSRFLKFRTIKIPQKIFNIMSERAGVKR